EQHRDVDPVHPANRSWVLVFQAVHGVGPPRSRPLSRGLDRPALRYSYFLSPCILSPPILSLAILSVAILSPPILSVAILSVAILSALLLSLLEVDESPQPTTAKPRPIPTTSTTITDQILRMLRLLFSISVVMTCLRSP